jgi:hypothetical protein
MGKVSILVKLLIDATVITLRHEWNPSEITFALLRNDQGPFEITFLLPCRYNCFRVSLPDPLLAEIYEDSRGSGCTRLITSEINVDLVRHCEVFRLLGVRVCHARSRLWWMFTAPDPVSGELRGLCLPCPIPSQVSSGVCVCRARSRL